MTRKAFEAFISAPPFEMPIDRFDDRSAWPGSYTELEVDLAWQAWKAATDAALERAAEVCDRAEVFAWEQWKATGNPHTEGVSDGAASLARDIRALKLRSCRYRIRADAGPTWHNAREYNRMGY